MRVIHTRIATLAAAIGFGCVILSGASAARAVEGRAISAPASYVIAVNDHDGDDKKKKGRKIRRHGYVNPPAWYNGSNGYFANGAWHHKRAVHTRDRDRDKR